MAQYALTVLAGTDPEVADRIHAAARADDLVPNGAKILDSPAGYAGYLEDPDDVLTTGQINLYCEAVCLRADAPVGTLVPANRPSAGLS